MKTIKKGKCIVCNETDLTDPLALICDECIKKIHTGQIGEASDTEEKETFVKADSGKLEWSLVPFREFEDVVRILQFGAKKYSVGNWQKCDNWKRYEDAAMRHLVSYIKGEHTDPESGKSHMAHLICNALFLMWHDNELPNEETSEANYT